MSASSSPQRSRLAVTLATGAGLGHLPIAPGTWGSLGGVALYALAEWWYFGTGVWRAGMLQPSWAFSATLAGLNVLFAVGGVWAATQAAVHFQKRDPSPVVVDEISGQLLVFVAFTPLGWNEILAGFLLFRAFDIWKPFPARQAEAWPGGWGIMADDWFAGLYAAAALGLLRSWW